MEIVLDTTNTSTHFIASSWSIKLGYLVKANMMCWVVKVLAR